MLWNKDLKNYKEMKPNGLTAVGYLIGKYAYMAAVVLIMYVAGGLEWWWL